ncbi:acetate--CoA ligase family protein [Cumulibacter manganitolerans]|uniref:acetate--CoA ligase family protein n=1 Tax=Cumulibacter manganitolerans TaxID=1884992 RepID=UPI001E550461|nr:acetate--CoA ligase family protein [Cumulibacter manganitolerans]
MVTETGTTNLTRLFRPTSIAIIGASARPESLGGRVMSNLIEYSDYDGELYLVNQRGGEIAGKTCFTSAAEINAPIDVAVVVIPSQHVIAALRDCAAAGCTFAIVLSSGFGETGEDGQRAQHEMRRIADESGMRIVGPNCPGLTNLVDGIGMTFSPGHRHDNFPGPLGLATQGGGLGRNLLQSGFRGGGAAMWASVGNAVDLDVPDIIEYFTQDTRVLVIAALLEGINDGPALVAALRSAAEADKPVVALKVGRSEYGVRAVQSHTAALAGSAAVNSAVLAQYGAIEVDDVDELVDVSWLLSRAKPSEQTRIAVWGASGGALSLAADLVGQAGLTMATFSPTTTAELEKLLPDFGSVDNPVDVTASVITDPEVLRTLEIVANDPNVDLVLIPDPLDYGDSSIPISSGIAAAQKSVSTPIVPVWMSDGRGPGFQILAEARLCPPRSLTKAISAIQRWAAHGRWRATYGGAVPATKPAVCAPRRGAPLDLRTEPKAKAWLAEHGISVPSGVLVGEGMSAREAVAELGGRLVAKVVSADIAHKSDVGGVIVGVDGPNDADAARDKILENVRRLAPDRPIEGVLFEQMIGGDALEMIVGVHRDPVFGHVITVGAGGVLVEFLADVSSRLLPIDERVARDMVDSLSMRPVLDGPRGARPRDIDALIDLLVRISDLVESSADQIEEIDLNPVLVRPAGEGIVVLDALVVPSGAVA